MQRYNTKTRTIAAALSAAAGLGGLTTAASADFVYSNFSAVPGLTFNGVAQQTGSVLSVTPPVRAAAGSVWHTAAKQNVAGGFESNFRFRHADIAGAGSDGFAFVIQNSSATALGGTGGAMGYGSNLVFPGPGQTGITNSLAIEFDAWDNTGDWSDFGSGNHISVQTGGSFLANSPDAMFSLGHVVPSTNFSDGLVHDVRISYVPSVVPGGGPRGVAPGSLRIYLDSMETPVLSVNVDLATALSLDSGTAWVGFTAGTGALVNVQRHEIHSWDFITPEIPAPGAAALLGLGGLVAARRRRH